MLDVVASLVEPAIYTLMLDFDLDSRFRGRPWLFHDPLVSATYVLTLCELANWNVFVPLSITLTPSMQVPLCASCKYVPFSTHHYIVRFRQRYVRESTLGCQKPTQ